MRLCEKLTSANVKAAKQCYANCQNTPFIHVIQTFETLEETLLERLSHVPAAGIALHMRPGNTSAMGIMKIRPGNMSPLRRLLLLRQVSDAAALLLLHPSSTLTRLRVVV